jgi:hypothetical protein
MRLHLANNESYSISPFLNSTLAFSKQTVSKIHPVCLIANEGKVFGKSVGMKIKTDPEITDISFGYNFIFFDFQDAMHIVKRDG